MSAVDSSLSICSQWNPLIKGRRSQDRHLRKASALGRLATRSMGHAPRIGRSMVLGWTSIDKAWADAWTCRRRLSVNKSRAVGGGAGVQDISRSSAVSLRRPHSSVSNQARAESVPRPGTFDPPCRGRRAQLQRASSEQHRDKDSVRGRCRCPSGSKGESHAQADQLEIKAKIDEMLNRWPAVGLAVGVVRNGSSTSFTDMASPTSHPRRRSPKTPSFGSPPSPRPFATVAVMQLEEQGLIDLDAPANDYLHSYQLVPAKASFRAATVRHLLTHAAGVRAIRTPSRSRSDASWAGAPLPDSGCRWRSTTAAVCMWMSRRAPGGLTATTVSPLSARLSEDVTGLPLDRYFRECLFGSFPVWRAPISSSPSG